ncbi:MAG: ABC transporter ATP-binding protein [Methanosarcinaceae archaeon]|nr:ABC transporter ATP-binding protein [Methanosarcinaceae archaeon]
MIEIKNLSGNLGEFHLHDINLKVNKGEYLAILGPTGAGKTVLVEYITGIYKPDKGSILVDGEDITPLYPEERNIGYVPQDYALFPNLTVTRNIAYGLEARRMPSDKVHNIVSGMISLLKIEYIQHRMPLNLSGGEKQRVALGRALATEPRVLLLDEPLSALDENLRTEMARELRQIQRGVNGTFIHVCHNFEEASDVADQIAIMNDGKIIQTGALKEIMDKPKNEFLAKFVKSQNVFDATSDGSVLKVGKITLVRKNPSKGNVIIAIRPENIAIVENKNDKGQNVFSGKVKSGLSKLYFTEVALDIGLPLIIHTASEKKYSKGDSLKVRIPPEKIVIMEKD